MSLIIEDLPTPHWPETPIDTGSFLASELSGHLAYFQEESVVIPGATAGFPVNEGLTTASLSNWGVSSHMGFSNTLPGYLSINDAGSHLTYRNTHVVTVVTSSYAGGGTTGGDDGDGDGGEPPIPEPSTLLLLSSGFLGTGLLRRRSKK